MDLNIKMENCEHKRIRKNYPFGKKSTATKSCKDCGKIIKNKDIEQNRREKKQNGRKK